MKKQNSQILLGLFLIILVVAPAGADVYKWVDADGVTHFSDKPPQNKESSASIEIQPDAPPSTYQPPPEPDIPPDTESGFHAEPQPPAAKAKKTAGVQLYVTSWCKYCKMAEAFLKNNRVAYTKYDIEKDAAAAQRRKNIDSRPGVPLAVINGRILLGFSEAAYKSALQGSQ
jgi:glutaredoxin